MIGDVLIEVLEAYPCIFSNCDRKDISYILKELIIMEIVCLEGETVKSREIQSQFEFLINSMPIPTYLTEPSKSAKGKTNLRVLLNNILSSNLKHQNGLTNRPEIKVIKENSTYFYSCSDCFINDVKSLFNTEDDYVDLFKMGVFYQSYNYIPLLIQFLSLKPNHCQSNSNHINKPALFPIFRNSKSLLRCSILNLTYLCSKCLVDIAESAVTKFEERKY